MDEAYSLENYGTVVINQVWRTIIQETHQVHSTLALNETFKLVKKLLVYTVFPNLHVVICCGCIWSITKKTPNQTYSFTSSAFIQSDIVVVEKAKSCVISQFTGGNENLYI